MHLHGGQNWLGKSACPWCRLNEVIQERDALRAENEKLAAKMSRPQRRKAMSNQTQDLIYQNEELKALLTNAEAELTEAEAELTEALTEQYRFREQLETLQFAFAKVTAERDGLKEALKKIRDITLNHPFMAEALRDISAIARENLDEITRIGQEGGEY